MKLPRILLLLALAAPGFAWGQAAVAPERIARLSYVEGEVMFQAPQKRPTSRLPDRPLRPGDRLTTDPRGRAELALGIATLRLDERSELAFLDLDETAVRAELAEGSASVYLNELAEGETFEIVTPNASIALQEPGEYRVDVNARDASVLTVHAGAAEVETADGPVRVVGGQRVRIEGREAIARLEQWQPADAFDDWVLDREVRLAETEQPRYTPYEGERYDPLDRYGEWYDDSRYGRVWIPGYGYTGWSPYGGGYWQRSGFGWSWYDPAPWGFFTYYDGRWTYLRDRDRWCWVPAPRHRPRHIPRDDDGPGWYPRGRETPESAPRTADRRSHDGNASAPVMIPRAAPRRGEAEPRSAPARESTGERPRTTDRGSTPPPPAAAPPQGGGTTMRPSRTETPRSETRSEPAPHNREFGARREP